MSAASTLDDWQGAQKDIMKPGAYPSMDVLTAGAIPPNASDLILSDRMKSTIAELKAGYDYVILDTPPILLISDALGADGARGHRAAGHQCWGNPRAAASNTLKTCWNKMV